LGAEARGHDAGDRIRLPRRLIVRPSASGSLWNVRCQKL
jgi:hypothetical protein